MLENPILLGVFIVLARIADVSLGTLRTVCVVKNKRNAAVLLGFFECLIWVFAVSKVATNLDQPFLAVCYALGFALGNYVGLVLERRLALGDQVLRVFTRKTDIMLPKLREQGLKVTKFTGEGKGSTVDMLLIKMKRKVTPKIVQAVRDVDDEAFYFIDDIGETSEPQAPYFVLTGWRVWAKKK